MPLLCPCSCNTAIPQYRNTALVWLVDIHPIAASVTGKKEPSDRVFRQLVDQGLVDLGLDQGAVLGVFAGDDLGLAVQPVDQVAAVVGQQDGDLDVRPRQLVGDDSAELVQALT